MFYRCMIIVFIFAGILMGCSNESPSKGDASAADSISRPDSECFSCKTYLLDGSQVTTEIYADKIIQFKTNDSTMAYNLNIISFDSIGQENSRVTGDSGIINEQAGLFVIFGHVVAIAEDSTQLETEVLHWNPKTDRIYTDAFVRFTTPDGTISRGWGFETNQRIKKYKILHRVSGETEVGTIDEL